MDMYRCNFAVESLTEKIISLIDQEFPVLDPSANNQSMDHIDPDMSHPSLTVKVLASFLPERLLRHLEQACRRRNTSLPINQLPGDVLTEIFRVHMESDFERSDNRGINYPRRRTTLAAVCTSWRALINHTPALWTICTSDSPEKVLRETFQKSGNSPLRVFAKMRGEGPSFWRMIAPHFNRCYHVEAPVSSALREMIKLGAPLLEILDVDRSMNPLEFDLFEQFPLQSGDRCCPRIKILRLSGLGLPWGSSPFSNLQILDLRSIRTLPLRTVLDMLERSPYLTDFRLYSLLSEVPEPLDEYRNVSLVNLQVLHLVGLPVRIVEYLLRVIQPPTLQEIKIAPSGFIPLQHQNLPSYILASITHILREGTPFAIEEYNTHETRTIRAIGSDVCHLGPLESASLQWWLERIYFSCNSAPSELLLCSFSAATMMAVDPYGSVTNVTLPGRELYGFFLLICRHTEGGVWLLPKLSSITLSGEVRPTPKLSDLTQIADLLYHRFVLSPAVSALMSVNYEKDEPDPQSDSVLREMLYRLPGCKIRRIFDGILYD